MIFTVSSVIWMATAIICSFIGAETAFIYFCMAAGVLYQIAGTVVSELKK